MKSATLLAELIAAGLPVTCCNSRGEVSPPLSDPGHIALAAQIVAAHDPAPTYAERRAKEYPSADALVVALWERIVEGRTASSEALQKLRSEVKARHPKPV